MIPYLQDVTAVIAVGCMLFITIKLLPMIREHRKSLDEGDEWKNE